MKELWLLFALPEVSRPFVVLSVACNMVLMQGAWLRMTVDTPAGSVFFHHLLV